MMKPIKLKMSYFGPFESESIDFSKVQNQMFLISGKTGSGKTMIFDAITFALYGEASTSDRNEQSVRSQFATDSDISKVSLEFSVRDKVYTVERELTYQKEGNKSKVPNKAALYDYKGKVLSSQVRGVTERVIEIVKLSVNQFRQILILPQGEFKRLLMSKSEEKQSILRTLFQTGRFVRFEETLKQEGKAKQKSLELIESRIDGLFQSVVRDEDIEDKPGMKDKLTSIETLIKQLESEKKQCHQESKEIQKKIIDTESDIKRKEHHNNQLNELNNIEHKQKQLYDKGEHIKVLEKRLKAYQFAVKIQYELRQEWDTVNEISEKTTQKTSIEQEIKEISSRLKIEQTELVSLKDMEKSIKKSDKWLMQTERFLDEKYQGLKESREKGNAYISEIEKSIEERKKEKINIREEIKKNTVSQDEIDLLKERLFSLEKEKEKYQTKIQQEKEYVEIDKAIHSLLSKEQVLKENLESCKKEREQMEADLKGKYLTDDKVHIEHLLEHLTVGEACPVCRQTVENVPASVTYLTDEEEKQFTSLKKRHETIESDIDAVSRDLYAERKNIENKERIDLNAAQSDLVFLNESIDKETQALTEKREAFQKLMAQKETVQNLERKQYEDDMTLQTYQTRLNDVVNMLTDFTNDTGFEAYESFIESFHKEKDEVEQFYKKFEITKRNVERLNSEYVKLEERLKVVKERLNTLEMLNEKYKMSVDQFLKEYQFEAREAVWDALDISDNEEIEKEIQSYYEAARLYETQAAQLKEVLKSMEMYDLIDERLLLQSSKEQMDTLNNRQAAIQNTIEQNENIYQKLKGYIDELGESEKELTELIELSNIVSGKNHAKVSLERYVLTYYLERILNIANKRLLEMTNHRYALVRSTSKMNRQTGLDIEVFDYYNNNQRHITSLSGGETFQASLTLALALNEALQQESGGISLDTMLIDEGFGTLDLETLDIAINTLIDLQSSGKTIGVISHVAELKERMDHILYVTANDEKSSTHFNM